MKTTLAQNLLTWKSPGTSYEHVYPRYIYHASTGTKLGFISPPAKMKKIPIVFGQQRID